MWDEHRVLALQQARVHSGLVLEHIEAGAGDLAAAQRLHQRGFVDDRTARGVHQERTGPHHPELIGAHQVMRRRAVRTVEADHITGAQQLVLAHELRTEVGFDAR